jgi:hypothetical protein
MEGPLLLYEEFKAAVREILAAHTESSPALVPIPFVRRALAERVGAEEFDVMLCTLQRDGLVHLLSHVALESLPDAERSACVRHPSGVVVYWVCGA